MLSSIRSLSKVFRLQQSPEDEEISVHDFERAVMLKRQEIQQAASASRRLEERRRQAEMQEKKPSEQTCESQESAEAKNMREVREFMEQRAHKRREYQAKKAQVQDFMAQRAQARREYLANKAGATTVSTRKEPQEPSWTLASGIQLGR